MTRSISPRVEAARLWDRYVYCKRRGHMTYQVEARTNEDYYLGGGLQWPAEVKEMLESQGRMPSELNLIMPAVNSILGYQINNRLDPQLRPRGGAADEQLAKVLEKVVKYVLDDNSYYQVESEVFADGAIQQRGFIEIRLDYTKSIFGEIRIESVDPLDVLPDPDAKSYEPEGWRDVRKTGYFSVDEIRQRFGEQAARTLLREAPSEADHHGDHGTDQSDEVERPKFGMEDQSALDYGQGSPYHEDGEREYLAKYRILETQEWRYGKFDCAISPTGEIYLVEDAGQDRLAEWQAAGYVFQKRMHRRVWHTVSTEHHVLWSGWSPFPFFTLIPYFYLFRRGRTRGMVDNARSPQDVTNKAMSQTITVLNGAANTGWIADENALVNMTDRELEERGAENGLVIIKKQGKEVQRINPLTMPEGLHRLTETMPPMLQQITGANSAMQGTTQYEESGKALQSRQFAAQQQQALPLDNLSRTRRMVVKAIIWIVQHFYTYERVFRITEEDAYGRPRTTELQVNYPSPDGQTILNDLTIGEYDIVIAERPATVTLDNSQFNQVLEMRDKGIPIPDPVVIRYSNLTDKTDIIGAMESQAGQADPEAQANATLLEAKAMLTKAEAVNKRVEAMYSATTAGQLLASIPQIAGMADQMLKSAGFEDQDAPPIVAEPAGITPGAIPAPAENTNPLTPTNPGVGLTAGIESGERPAPAAAAE